MSYVHAAAPIEAPPLLADQPGSGDHLMSQDDALSALVLDVLRHVAPEMDGAGIDPGKTFHDQLGIDSIDFLNLVMGLEDRLGVRIGELDYPKLSSLGGCIAYFGSRMPVAAIAAAVPPDLGATKV